MTSRKRLHAGSIEKDIVTSLSIRPGRPFCTFLLFRNFYWWSVHVWHDHSVLINRCQFDMRRVLCISNSPRSKGILKWKHCGLCGRLLPDRSPKGIAIRAIFHLHRGKGPAGIPGEQDRGETGYPGLRYSGDRAEQCKSAQE